jgi:hypothetical protein
MKQVRINRADDKKHHLYSKPETLGTAHWDGIEQQDACDKHDNKTDEHRRIQTLGKTSSGDIGQRPAQHPHVYEEKNP